MNVLPNDDDTNKETKAVAPSGCPAGADAAGTAEWLAPLYGPAAELDPMGLYEKLRGEHGPVAPVVLEGGVPAWLVLGYRENMEVARTPTRFTRDTRLWRDWQEGKIPEDSPLMSVLGWKHDCVSTDGEEHQRLRGAVTASLAHFDQRGVRRHIQRYANQLIDGFAEDGSAELVTRYTHPLPMLVLGHLFGLTEEEGLQLVEASLDLNRGTDTAAESDKSIVESLSRLIDRKTADAGHDFASYLIAHPAKLTRPELEHHLRLVLIANETTTTHLIASTLRMVFTDPRFRASLTGGQMTVTDAVEQVLWDEPPLRVCPGRIATNDTELGGQLIKAGDLLLLGLAAGNVDPAVRPDPQAPVHGNRSHLAFSRGPHECPGQEIARAVAEIAVDTLLVRLPDLRMSVTESELTWLASPWSRHMLALPVEFTPRRPAATTGKGAAAATTPTVPAQRRRVPGPRTEPATTGAKPAPAGQTNQSGPAAPETETVAADPVAQAPKQRRIRWSSLFGWLHGR